jgi:glutathione S-transferase
MNYEQKYKDALKWMQGLYSGLHGATKEEAERYFPELKESKDERIRKAIYNALKYLETELYCDFLDDVDILDAYAWLEKQGKQTHSTLSQSEVTKTSGQ